MESATIQSPLGRLRRPIVRTALLVLGLLAVASRAQAQRAVTLEEWNATGLPESAWMEPFNTLNLHGERLRDLPPVEGETAITRTSEPVVLPVGYTETSAEASAAAIPVSQPLALPRTQVDPAAPGSDPLATEPADISDSEAAESTAGDSPDANSTAGPPAAGDAVPGDPAAPAGASGSGAGTSAAGQGGQNERTFGRQPTNNALQFLRRDSVLIGAGKTQFDYGINYSHFENDIPVAQIDGAGTVVGVSEGLMRQRLLYSPFGLRYGFTDKCQFNAYLPVGWSNSQFSVNGVDNSQNTGGLGDLTTGLSYQLCDGKCAYEPDVIATFGFTAPTGDFNAPIFGLVPGSALGQGFWALNANLLFINRYDPIIAFYGVGYRHLFERMLGGVAFQPGEQLSYQFGLGFSVNDRVTLSATLFGYYVTNTELNQQTFDGSNLEPISLRFAATIMRDKKIIEPFAAIGMTQDAPSAYLGIIWTLF